jgi:ABC-2 type transport system ATP-binding protein
MEGLLQQAGEMTILVSSHELGELDSVATHAAFLSEGKLLFEESMSDLMLRFREVRVTLEQQACAPGEAPKDWVRMRAMGNVLSFVDTRFSEENFGERIQSVLGTVRRIDTQPMALRSIFIALEHDAAGKES